MNVGPLNHEGLRDLLTKGLWRNQCDAFVFFRKCLVEVCGYEFRGRHPRFDEQQLDYIACILTAFSMKGIDAGNWPVPSAPSRDLQLLEKRFNVPNLPLPPWRCERLGRILLFMGSFERERVERYHTEYWIILIGERLFLEAAVGPKTDLLLGISGNFALWLNNLRILKSRLIRARTFLNSPVLMP